MVITLRYRFWYSLISGRPVDCRTLKWRTILSAKGKTYDDYIGERALEKEGKQKWNKRMQKVFKVLKTVFNYDTLYIGGGNSDKLNFKLDKNMKIVTNQDGIKGGARLWLKDARTRPDHFSTTNFSINIYLSLNIWIQPQKALNN